MWGLLLFLVGIAYGYMAPGRQDKSRLFFKGLLIGIVGAILLTIIGWVTNSNPLAARDTGFFGFIWAAIVLSLLFVLGVFVGDFFDKRRGYSGRSVRRV